MKSMFALAALAAVLVSGAAFAAGKCASTPKSQW